MKKFKCLYCGHLMYRSTQPHKIYSWCYRHHPDVEDIEYSFIDNKLYSILITASASHTNMWCIKLFVNNDNVHVMYEGKESHDFDLNKDFHLNPLNEIIESIKALILFS